MPAVATVPQKRAVKVSEAAATKVAAPVTDDRKSAIVTVRNPRARRHIESPDLTEEEINRRADAAEALFRKIARGNQAAPAVTTPQRHWRS